MARMQRLFRRANGAWTFRVAVPEHLRDKIGKKEIWKSLGAVTHQQAQKLARIESLKADALFQAAIEETVGTNGGTAPLSDAEILLLAQRYLHRLEANAAQVVFDEADRCIQREKARENAFDVAQGGVLDPGLQEIATGLAGDAGRTIAGRDVLRITEAVQRALLEHYAREEDRASLRNVGSYDPAFSSVDGKAQPVQALSVRRAIELFKNDPERASVAPKTKAAYQFRYAVLEELLGPDKDVASITRADVREVRDVLLILPPNASKRFPGKGLREIADIASHEKAVPMSAKSAALYVEALSALFNWLAREEMAARNPAVGLRGPTTDDATNRRPFTYDELNTLFAAAPFTNREGSTWMYWLPRLALFTGARFAELLALRPADVIVEDGITCISIAPYEGRKLKTKGSHRLVPLHPKLIETGFLQHVAKQQGKPLLFPDAVGPAHMITARNKEIGRAIRSVIKDRSVVFHSLRHTFKDAAARARMPRELLAQIGGWKTGDRKAAMDAYGREKLLPVIYDELSKVEFHGVKI
ncbi:site-specific integrase [Sinorhizobium meliloti]|uniref:site-specific integrase n=1 Tax=Rhizobium meliloti TaxID=382 RepID=UPI0012955EAE|nr:site-specific integrase [Sinorhizobium meliloti]MQX74647.1 tyrosine-type recombinase/integrase [Sinorhizobium meliloti]